MLTLPCNASVRRKYVREKCMFPTLFDAPLVSKALQDPLLESINLLIYSRMVVNFLDKLQFKYFSHCCKIVEVS